MIENTIILFLRDKPRAPKVNWGCGVRFALIYHSSLTLPASLKPALTATRGRRKRGERSGHSGVRGKYMFNLLKPFLELAFTSHASAGGRTSKQPLFANIFTAIFTDAITSFFYSFQSIINIP